MEVYGNRKSRFCIALLMAVHECRASSDSIFLCGTDKKTRMAQADAMTFA
jgi:hypothetical protein